MVWQSVVTKNPAACTEEACGAHNYSVAILAFNQGNLLFHPADRGSVGGAIRWSVCSSVCVLRNEEIWSRACLMMRPTGWCSREGVLLVPALALVSQSTMR